MMVTRNGEMGRPKYQQRYSYAELMAIADRQLARIRRGEPMNTIEQIKPERGLKPEGERVPHRNYDVST